MSKRFAMKPAFKSCRNLPVGGRGPTYTSMLPLLLFRRGIKYPHTFPQTRFLSSLAQPLNTRSGHHFPYQMMQYEGSRYTGYQLNSTEHYSSRLYSTEQTDNPKTTTKHSKDSPLTESTDTNSEYKLVYTAPLKGAVRAVKVFSLSTATATVIGGPILVWLGNDSVPLSGRVILSSLVMLVGVSTTALLHWLVKGYVIRMYFNEKTNMIQLYTLSMLGRRRLHEFEVSEARTPNSTAFSSFQARGKSYFVHADAFKDQKLLAGLLGVYADVEITADVERTDI